MTEKRKDGEVSQKIWTPANTVTFLRICLVPVFVVALLSPWPEWFGIIDVIPDYAKAVVAACVFVFISCTDWIDGYLARSRNEVTDLGKFLDPLADKILVAAALIALVELQVIPSWPVLIILTREFIVSGIRMLAATKGFVIAASWYGKAKTVTQIIAIVMFLIKDYIAEMYAHTSMDTAFYVASWIVMVVALVLTVISMFDYISKARPLLFPPKSAKGSDSDSDTASAMVSNTVDDDHVSNNEAGSGVYAEPEDGEEDALYFERSYGLSSDVIDTCRTSGRTICTAESLTGGMISSALTSVPGSSDVVNGAFVTYALREKAELLGVDKRLLDEHGAVNEATAIQMAEGAARRTGSDVAVSATGIAGPGGSEPGKPVGTVFVGILVDGDAKAFECHFEGDRQDVRQQTVLFALEKACSLLSEV